LCGQNHIDAAPHGCGLVDGLNLSRFILGAQWS
jgi:hypothetical protein